MMIAPVVDYKIHWLKMMSVPESRAVVGRHDGINGRDRRPYMTMPPGRSQALGLTVSTTSFGYPHPDSDARRLTELAIVATLWSAGEVIP